MEKQSSKRFAKKSYIAIASMLFGMFFGAGNLIFPIHLGQLAGHNWFVAGLGFLITGTILPLLAIIAISITRSNGIYDLARPIGKHYATFFMVLTCATLGPLFATPRTATTPFQIGIAPHVSAASQPLWLLIYSLIFFGITYWAARKPTDIVDSIGKLLNPLFLLLLAVIFGFAFSQPMASAAKQASTAAYTHGAFLNGFLEGYNTMDALAGLLFGIAVVTTIRALGEKRPGHIAAIAAKSSTMSIILEAAIYMVLIWIGATTLSHFKIAADGGITFNQIASHFMGMPGEIILAIMATLTCLTTSIGLSTSFSEALRSKFPRIGYQTWLIICVGASLLIANIGLDQIIAWSLPMLMFLYPLAITLIIMAIISPLFNNDRIVYIMTTIFTIIPAFFGGIASAPAIITQSGWAQALLKIDAKLPFASSGMDWVLPAGIGMVIGLTLHFIRMAQAKHATRAAAADADED